MVAALVSRNGKYQVLAIAYTMGAAYGRGDKWSLRREKVHFLHFPD
jgi:hypothetical protein